MLQPSEYINFPEEALFLSEVDDFTGYAPHHRISAKATNNFYWLEEQDIHSSLEEMDTGIQCTTAFSFNDESY